MSSDSDRAVGLTHDIAEQSMAVAFKHPIRLMVQALGLPPKSMIDRARAVGVPVGAQVGSAEHAVRQVEMRVDVIVAQGTEAGGHCGEVSTIVLVPEVIQILRRHSSKHTPVLAAGGIVPRPADGGCKVVVQEFMEDYAGALKRVQSLLTQ